MPYKLPPRRTAFDEVAWVWRERYERERRRLQSMRRSRDMWKARALSYGRGGAGQKRRAA